MKKVISIGNGENCTKCSKPMERREHTSITPQLLNKPYYFSAWDVCRVCRHIQHYEYLKVFNKINSKLIQETTDLDNRAGSLF